MKVDGSVAIISIKNFPIGLHVMYLYFLDTPRILANSVTVTVQNRAVMNIREVCTAVTIFFYA
jgi:ubiquitin C-terminal hydrolase